MTLYIPDQELALALIAGFPNFSTTCHLGSESFLLSGAVLGRGVLDVSSIPGLYALDATSTPPLSYNDNQKCLQTYATVLLRTIALWGKV